MKTSELMNHLKTYAVETRTADEQHVAAIVARARTEIDLFIEDRHLKPLVATAKLARLQNKTLHALSAAGLDPNEALSLTNRMGLPVMPSVGHLPSALPTNAPDARSRGEMEVAARAGAAEGAAHFTHFLCRDGTIVSIFRSALHELDADLFKVHEQGGQSPIASPSGTIDFTRFTRSQVLAIKDYADNGALRGKYDSFAIDSARKP